MKKRIILLINIFVFASLAMAQPGRGKFNPEEFKAKLECFITGEAGFSEAEAGAFYPIYHEMKGKQRQIQRNIFQLKKDAQQGNASDKDYSRTINKIKELGVEMAQIEANYYKKLCNAVPPQKVYKAMCAEDKFHRQMLEGFGHRGNHSRDNRHQ
ncbi:MAG: hypothetical protein IJ537_00390 [Bacteroidaceae bacterium]|nr:hypothetical protein [Bacteroidaceae bacterium]MBQ9171241.1 hypothetical protein [Bacteroidaceae bacterium]